MRPPLRADLCVFVALMGAGLLSRAGAQAPAALSPRLHEVIAAEDARARTPPQLQTLIASARDQQATIEVQQAAVRALGRLERPALIEHMLPGLDSSTAAIRSEAANALAQALTNAGDEAAQYVVRVETALAGKIEAERDPNVRRAILQSIGRLPYKPEDRKPIERLLGRYVPVASTYNEQTAAVTIGALNGLEALYRGWPRPVEPDPEVISAIDRIRQFPGVESEYAQDARRSALATAIAAGQAPVETITSAMGQRDDQMRRLGILAAALPASNVDLRPLVTNALHDPSPMVRYEAFRVFGRRYQGEGCEPIARAITGPYPKNINGETQVESETVVLLALDLLGEPCPDAGVVDLLARESASTNWRRAAHAYVSLAKRAPDRARPMLPSVVGHRVWQVRMYSARAAASLNDRTALEKLANDDNDNVREAAVTALQQMGGRAADAVYVASLARPDYQLVRTAARALQGTGKNKVAAAALVTAFQRISRERRDTSRDPRMAILERLKETASLEDVKPLEAYVNDFDPRVAAECRRLLADLGAPVSATADPVAQAPVTPSLQELSGLIGARARMTMARGGVIELSLLTTEAPLTVARFARLARAGYYNNLTFHRVVPNFVIQGGSPGANEYMGDGPYMRDEVGLRSHRRGTAGISTRGRDTGDAQIFVNLVDNTRLDHTYTVFAEVTQGMDVVDAVQEGDVIARVEIIK